MQMDSDDFDWAFGELLHLFSIAGRTFRFPHEIDPELFHAAWTVLNAQPFEVRDKCQKQLMEVWRSQPVFRSRFMAKRYENAWTH